MKQYENLPMDFAITTLAKTTNLLLQVEILITITTTLPSLMGFADALPILHPQNRCRQLIIKNYNFAVLAETCK